MVTRRAPSVLTSSCSRTTSRSSRSIASGRRIPALLTTTSTAVSPSASTSASPTSSSPMSTPSTTRQPTAASSSDVARHVAITMSPRASTCRQSSSPMPRPAPVTSHVAMSARLVARGRRRRGLVRDEEHLLDDRGDVVVRRQVVHEAGAERERAAHTCVRDRDPSAAYDAPEDLGVAAVERRPVAAVVPAEADGAQLDRSEQLERRLRVDERGEQLRPAEILENRLAESRQPVVAE